MKLIGMKLKGIGPYEGEYSIDFAALSRSHMYLIEGETGAGKTTILDCITYALYGGPSVDGADKTRLRSRFLGLRNERSYVDLIFELNGRYYRVLREPEYQYAKKNGNGVSTHTAKAKLWRVDERIAELTADVEPDGTAERYFTFVEGEGNTTSLAIKASDVGAEIGQLIGLKREQFSKTIMLAQGRFSEFLRMTPDRRTTLVEELFSAQEYRYIQQILDDMRKERGRGVADLRERLTERIERTRRNAERFASMRDIETHAESSGNMGTGETDAEADSGKTTKSNEVSEPDKAAGADTDPTTDGDSGIAAEPEADTITSSDTVPESDPWFWGMDEAGAIAEPAHTSEAVVRQLDFAVECVGAQARDMLQNARHDVAVQEAAVTDRKRRRDLCRQVMHQAEEEHRLVEEHIRLVAQSAAVAEHQALVERSAEAEPILAKHRELEQRIQERDAVVKELNHTQDGLAEFPPQTELENRHREALQAAGNKESAEQKLKMAQTHQQLLDKVASTANAVADADKRFKDSQAVVERRRHVLDELPDDTEVAERLTRLIERLAGRDLLESQRRQVEDTLDHARKAVSLEADVKRRQESIDEAHVLSEAANRAYDEANRAFEMLGAAKYASELEDGRACPVCGSTEHPHPYQSPADAPTKKHVDALRKESRRREGELSKAEQELAKLQARLESEQEQSDGKMPEQAQEAVDQVNAALAELDKVAEQRKNAEREQQTIRQAKEALNDAQRRCAQAETELHHVRDANAAAVSEAAGHTSESVEQERAEARHQLDEAQRQAEAAERLATTIKERRQLETRQTELSSRVDTLSAQVKELEQVVHEMLDDHDFADIDQVKACALEPAETERFQREAKEHERRCAANAARLEDARRSLASSIVIGGVPEPEGVGTPDSSGTMPVAYADDGSPTVLGARIAGIDIEALDRAVTEAEQAQDAAQARLSTLTELDHERVRCSDDMTDTAREWDKAMREYEPVRTMALLTNGGKDSPSDRKLTLVAYAVTERFRDVLMRANEILKDIQGGVYELRLGDHEGRGGMKVGLPIDVFDRRNDQLRPPSSLSGGETFFVSLALALALADIIQAENGGLSMETLFIDEGFGTLSDDYLDDVMAVLRGIAKTRDIGIISHVGQLKDQIAERISVTRDGPDGESTLRVTV